MADFIWIKYVTLGLRSPERLFQFNKKLRTYGKAKKSENYNSKMSLYLTLPWMLLNLSVYQSNVGTQSPERYYYY